MNTKCGIHFSNGIEDDSRFYTTYKTARVKNGQHWITAGTKKLLQKAINIEAKSNLAGKKYRRNTKSCSHNHRLIHIPHSLNDKLAISLPLSSSVLR